MNARTTRARLRARVIAAAMQKGGVGKTTSVVNLARAAVARGLRVLVVDFDPQGNTTVTLARDEIADGQLTIADVVIPKPDATLREVIVPTVWEGADLAPATTDSLTEAEAVVETAKYGREHRLREALEPVLEDYDLVLIDNAPSLGVLMTNALSAADEVFGVTEADQWSADGLAELMRTVDAVTKYHNRDLRWSGILVSKWRSTADERHWLKEIIENVPADLVWDQDMIPLWTGIKTTINAGKGLDESREARLRVLAHTYRRIVARWIPDEEVAV